MVYEFRKYQVAAGRMEDLIERFKRHTLRLFKKHGITPVLFSRGEDPNPNVFQYVVSFPNKTTQTECWNAFLKDSERIRLWEESNKDRKLVTSITSQSFERVGV